jgi:signal transduction histidine kinase
MPLGLPTQLTPKQLRPKQLAPSQLAPRIPSRSFDNALNAVAYTCLICAVVSTAAFQVFRPSAILWPAMVAIAPMLILLFLSARTRDIRFSIAYLLVGASCTFLFVLTFSSQSPALIESDALALPMVALVMVGGSAGHLAQRLAWCTAGYLCAEISAGTAIVLTDQPWKFDATTLLAYAVVSLIFIVSCISRRSSRRFQPMLHRAGRDEQLAEMRHRIEVKAASMLHDTVLSHLSAIANSVENDLDPDLRVQVDHDLEILSGDEWLTEAEPRVDPALQQRWEQSPVYGAITEARSFGLEIECTGDFDAVSRLGAETSGALGLAVKQCLVNVLHHSGLTRAEVAVFDSEADVSVMVIDAGRGFNVEETAPDRLGIRNSVRYRIEAVGGAVQLWSTVGRGTSIMISVPSRSSEHSPGVDAS